MTWTVTHIAHSTYGHSVLDGVRARLRVLTTAKTNLKVFCVKLPGFLASPFLDIPHQLARTSLFEMRGLLGLTSIVHWSGTMLYSTLLNMVTVLYTVPHN
jgi:hypothetical protein